MSISSAINGQEFIEQIKAGSKDAFNLLYNQYGLKIFRFAVSYLKSESDAEELVQDVFLKLWDNRDKLDQSKNIRAYLYKIAVNTIYDFVRRKNREQAFYEFTKGETTCSDDTWHEVVFNDMLAHVQQLIKKMPEQRRKIFSMSKENGLSNDEIAEKLGLSKRTVENQLYRATAFVKKNINLDSPLAVLFFCLFC